MEISARDLFQHDDVLPTHLVAPSPPNHLSMKPRIMIKMTRPSRMVLKMWSMSIWTL